jgi:Tfp pilus assembly protein PilP
MNDKKISVLLIIILFISFPVLAAKTNKELYQNSQFRNPFVKYEEEVEEKEMSAEKAAEKETAVNNSDSISESSTKSDQNYSEQNRVYRFEEVIRGIPFSLTGIIKSNNKNLALINNSSGTNFVNQYYQENDYLITQINESGIIISSKGFRFRLTIGGEIDEI